MKVVAIDCGRSSVKYITANHIMGEFPSVVGEYRELKSKLKKNDLIIEFEGHKYFIGDLAERESEFVIKDQRATKIHERTKLLTLTAMHRAMEDGDQVLLVTGAPISDHTTEVKEGLRQLLTGEFTATVNGVTKSWWVKEVAVTAEGAVAVWSMKSIADVVHVIDPGSRKSNYAVTVNKGLWDKVSGSLDIGCETVANMNAVLFADSMAGMLSRRWLKQWGPVAIIGGMAYRLSPEFERYYQNVFVPENP